MAKTVIAAEVQVTGLDKAGTSVGNFRKELKLATQDLVSMSKEFGLGSEQAANAAKKVALLKDAIRDAKELSETFNPDKKFVALGGAIEGVTSGFSAYTGAMSLLGAKSEETEALLLKVQSAMALQQGISGIARSIDSFKLLGDAIKASTAFQKANNIVTAIATAIQRAFGVSVVQTGAAFNVLKGAIIATGIGALVVLIGVAVSKLNLFGDAAEDAAAKQQELTDAIDKQKKSLDDVIQSNQAYVDRLGSIVAINEKIQDLQAKGAGHEAEIAKLRKMALADELANIQVELSTKGDLLNAQENLTLKSKEYSLQKQIERVDIEQATKAQEKATEAAKKAADKADKLKEQLKKLAEIAAQGRRDELEAIKQFGQEQADADQAAADAEIERLKTNEQVRLETVQALAEQALLDDPNSIDNKIAKTNADFAIEMANFDGNEIQRQNLIKQHNAEVLAIETDAANTELALQQNKHQTELSAAAGALGALSDLIGRQTAAGKALAIAEATINTFKAGLQVFSQPMPGIPPVSLAIKIASMVAAIAGGIVTVKKIVSTKVPGTGGAGAIPSMPALPTAPIRPQVATTALDQNSINAVGNAANRSYVLETDVSGNQERIRRLNRAARIN